MVGRALSKDCVPPSLHQCRAKKKNSLEHIIEVAGSQVTQTIELTGNELILDIIVVAVDPIDTPMQ